MRTVTAAEMREMDRTAIGRYAIPGIVLMENAGRELAGAAAALIAPPPATAPIAVVCGSGNNAGDGLVAARYLFNRGYSPRIILLKPPEAFTGDPAANFIMVRHLGIPVQSFSAGTMFSDCALIIDALLGTGTRGPVTGDFRLAIERINVSGKPVVAADIPSGLDADSGTVHGVAVRATVTVTMGLVKRGLIAPLAAEHVGKLVVAEIGLPRPLLAFP